MSNPPRCFKCGKKQEITLLITRKKYRGFASAFINSVHSATLACPDRCDVDMRVYREATKKERAEWAAWVTKERGR